MNHRPLLQRFLIAILGCLVAIVLVGSPLITHPVRAVLPVEVVADVYQTAKDVKITIWDSLTYAAFNALFNAARSFAGQMAYDAANYLASGGKGQSALVYKKGFGSYLKDVGNDAAGTFVEMLSGDFQKVGGFDLCKPPDPKQLLNLQISLSNQIPGLDATGTERPKPKCDFKEIIANYNEVYTTLSNAEITDFVSTNFNANSSELGTSSAILQRAASAIADEVKKAALERSEPSGFKPVKGKVDDQIKTPAKVIEKQTEKDVVDKPKEEEADSLMVTLLKGGFSDLASYTASMFLNTLSSKMLKRVMEKGIVGAFDFSTAGVAGVNVNPNAISTRGKTDARKANIDLKNVSLLRVSDIEISSELIACPENRGLWNCTADEKLALLIQGKTDAGSLTIRAAMDASPSLLQAEWRLIPTSDVRNNQDRNCYKQAYCAGNLQKLRAMRILPVGLEFAANSDENVARCAGAGGCVTLREVVEGFANCNPDGKRDASFPWCKLVDPNWIVTSFQQQCQLTGFGDTLISSSLGQRREECRDIQTCLRRNDLGECVGGYGYCVADKSVYRFNANECQEDFASCRSFSNRAGQTVSYLRNTLDLSVCSADNVGCLSYATARDSTGTWENASPKMYFDKTLQPCSATDEGCTKLLSVEVGQSALNVIKNPSFETVGGTPLALENWSSLAVPAGAYVPPTVTTGTPALDGTVALDPSLNMRQNVDMIPLRLYTVSAWVRANGASPIVRIVARQMQNSTTESSLADLLSAYRSSGCTDVVGGGFKKSESDLSNDWSRYECSFLAVSSTRFAVIEIEGSDALIDAVQLEEGQFATNFLTGSNRDLAVLHMKVPPDDLRCTGTADEPSACNNFAKICRQVDAGCQGYTDKIGGPEVPAILSSNDICPQECVGYAEFRKQPAAFDLVNDPDVRFSDPADATSSYFIPSTARQCTQEQVGCESFTNVAAAAEGGEQSTSWSYLRSCRLPDATRTKTFFTWEGSESAGYQLRTFSLIAETGGLRGPETLAKRGSDGAFKEPSSCNEGLWRTGIDPDCRQFYDRDGNVFYNFHSQTILSTTECVNLRITRSMSLADCSKTGGDFSAATGDCFYNAYLGESRSCPVTAASCRAYSGATAGNTQVLVNENFRSGRGAFQFGTVSPESLLVGDQSLRLDEEGTGVNFDSEPDGLYRASFWAKGIGNDVTLTFVTRDASTPSAMPSQIGTTIRLSSDWQRYTVGLFPGIALATSTTFGIGISGPAGSTPSAFIDEVRIERIRDTAFVIQNSWNTPISCDRSFAGAVEPQAMLGCRAYTDRFNREVNAFRFTRLCRAEGIGCRAFVDTRNSESSYAESFNQRDVIPVPIYNNPSVVYGASTTTRLGDRMMYLIYDPSKVCQSENASCRAFGKPLYSVDRSSIESYQTVYYKDDITKYGDALCKPSEEMCEEFQHAGTNDYFRDPQRKVCELRQGVRLSSADFTVEERLASSVLSTLPPAEYDGWFQQGSSIPCYPDALEGGRNFPMPKRGDTVWTGWTGLCPGSAAECTEFRDINDTSDVLHRTGKPYFFVNDDRIDRTSCQDGVDLGQGCVLMRDMTDPILKYSVAASYKKYATNDFRPTPPVDCSRTPSDLACTSTASGTSTDANLLLKIKIDRDCAQWLGCKSSESVFDPATSQHKEICTNVALCDKSTDKPGEIFCANYVDRSATSTEAVMQTGKFFDINAYSERPVGLGEKDYSGYAVPNAFQIPELVTARVGVEGAKNVDNSAYRFALDYRLAAAVNMPSGSLSGLTGLCTQSLTAGPNEARVLDGTPVGLANPSLSLCQQVSTGIIGYYISAECKSTNKDFKCYLPVKAGGENYNFQNVSTRFSLKDPRIDPTLTNAYPPAECRVNPEADSPFGASYVTEWDLTTNPPKVISKLGGFTSANTCEFGEDCSCNYKRANYGSVAFSKFFAPLSQNVPPGICEGGSRDGQSCLPATIFQLPTQSGAGTPTDPIKAVEGSNASQTCGPAEGGGRCIAFNKLEIIKGVFGQCLERDETRIIGQDQNNKPCLTWNPTPILFGDKDSYHYQPTSGYMPPQNSGQYYCVSPVKKPVKVRMTYKSFQQYSAEDGTPAASIDPADDHTGTALYAGTMTKITYRDQWLSSVTDGVLGNDNNRYASIFGANPFNYYTATHDCEDADDDQDDGGHGNDPSGIRLIDAGSGYGEYFLRAHDLNLAGQLQLDAGDSATAHASLTDDVISYFKIDPISGPNGRIACGYQAAWVDGVSVSDYDDLEKSKSGDNRWRAAFYKNYTPYLTRGNEDVYAMSGGTPFKTTCVDGGDCYMKYWELDYRSANQKKFMGLQRVGENGIPTDAIIRTLQDIRKNPIRGTCADSKPYFAVRAMFESLASNTIIPDANLTKDNVSGPWSFVGFWVSACGGDTADQRYIYMNIEVGTASVCKELAEVRSKDSGQDAAFTDRVWSKGNFHEPGTGLQYGDNASPFSSAINTGPAGSEPLFQSGAEITGFSPLNPPTWLAPPSQTYYRNNLFPKDKYAYLSNLFARIYRVYRFYAQPVTKKDSACMFGQFKGMRCTGQECSYDGECKTPITEDERKALKVCGSGISHLLSCIESDNVCNAPSFAKTDGTIVSLLNTCAPHGTWTEMPSKPGFWFYTGGGSDSGPGNAISTEKAAIKGVFRCDNNIGPNISGTDTDSAATTASRKCSAPEAKSFDCPVKISGRTCDEKDGTTHVGKCTVINSSGIGDLTEEETKNTCKEDTDCNFPTMETCDAVFPGCVDGFMPVTAESCIVPVSGSFGRCVGGVHDAEVCRLSEKPSPGMVGSCEVEYSVEKMKAGISCLSVSQDPAYTPHVETIETDPTDPSSLVVNCQIPDRLGPNTSDDPDTDNNSCTHSAGYQPRLDLCPNPSDEFCGLIAYKIGGASSTDSLNPTGTSPLPTDHTLGMYTPTRLGFTAPGISAASFRYMAYYTPMPPRLAAPDIRNCPVPGQCPITRTDAFSFNGQTDGVVNVGGGSHKSTLRFYAWAAHNQMPLRQVVIDWGDGSKQRVDDTRMKNRKPFCGVQRECSLTPGLTCQTNADCPAGTGTCATVGTCAQNQNLACSQDSDCSVGEIKDTCTIRTMFGNSAEACQADYFDFAHLYSCGAQQTVRDATGLPDCSTSPRCSRDTGRTCTTPGSTTECAPGDTCLAGLAPVNGCFDETFRTCRFTPRVMIQDNFGWCTGECRASTTGGQPDDATGVTVKHPNGGCWAGETLGQKIPNIRNNTQAAEGNRTGTTVLDRSECREPNPDPDNSNSRPWIVYPGSLQLRESGEITR